MREIWARIEAVLRAKSPERFAGLAAGAPSEAIAAAERRLGITLPVDVRESYAIHDGSGESDIVPNELYGLMTVPLYSLDEMVREWEMWQEWGRTANYERPATPDEGPIKVDRYNVGWVPITWDGGAVNLCIDLDPGPGGVSGQVICLDHLDPVCVAAESWRVLLERYAADLETGRLRFEFGELVVAN
jgi:cell wall assembly regulator SMI1